MNPHCASLFVSDGPHEVNVWCVIGVALFKPLTLSALATFTNKPVR